MLSVDEPGSIAAPSRLADSRNKVATCIYQQPLQSAAAAAAATVWRCCCCTAAAVVIVITLSGTRDCYIIILRAALTQGASRSYERRRRTHTDDRTHTRAHTGAGAHRRRAHTHAHCLRASGTRTRTHTHGEHTTTVAAAAFPQRRRAYAPVAAAFFTILPHDKRIKPFRLCRGRARRPPTCRRRRSSSRTAYRTPNL